MTRTIIRIEDAAPLIAEIQDILDNWGHSAGGCLTCGAEKQYSEDGKTVIQTHMERCPYTRLANLIGAEPVERWESGL